MDDLAGPSLIGFLEESGVFGLDTIVLEELPQHSMMEAVCTLS